MTPHVPSRCVPPRRSVRPAIGPVPVTMDSPRPVFRALVVSPRRDRVCEKNHELPLRNSASRDQSKTFASFQSWRFCRVLFRLWANAAMAGRDFSRRLLFRHVSPRPRLFDHFYRRSFMSSIIVSLKQISDPARRLENRVRQRHFLFRHFIFLMPRIKEI